MMPSMKFRDGLFTTYRGLIAVGLLGGVGGGWLSLILFLFRAQCEPLLAAVLPLFMRLTFHVHFHYRPSEYYWIAAYTGGLALMWTLGIGWALVQKPGQDRRIDQALRRRARPSARGAPLDP